MVFLSRRALEGLKTYKYKPGGYTWLDDLHTPFWNWLTDKLPMWLAPNLITLTGLIALIIGYVVMWAYVPSFIEDAPSWVYLLCGAAVIIYTNLDCIDGKQARRTKSSSPLGQLFDHGCDAIALHLMISMAQSAIQQPANFTCSVALILAVLPWICSQYEEYHTGSMMYGNGYFGILEANYILAAVVATSGFLGPAFWKRVLVSNFSLPIPGFTPLDLTPRHCFIFVDCAAAVNQTFGQLYRVFTYPVEKMDAEERGNKDLGLGARLRHLFWVAVLLGLGFSWTSRDQATMKPMEARLLSLAFGVIFAMVATKLIMDHMCKEPFRPTAWALLALALSTGNAAFPVVDSYVANCATCVFVLVAYCANITGVVKDICAFLQINCLTIKTKAK